jgi:hypothetical protein
MPYIVNIEFDDGQCRETDLIDGATPKVGSVINAPLGLGTVSCQVTEVAIRSRNGTFYDYIDARQVS